MPFDLNNQHEANRRHWNEQADLWEERSDREGRWSRCREDPGLAFEGGALQLIQEVSGGVGNKRVCVIGSGDNMAAFALAGMGARVTSTDISEEQLATASRRAESLGLSISFVRLDSAGMGSLADSSFDVVCSTNGFFVWIADLEAVFREVARILEPGGCYVFFDVHPFQRPWKEQGVAVEMEKPYWSTGPFRKRGTDSCNFHWTLADLLNPMAAAGLTLVRLLESPARDTRYWRDSSGGEAGGHVLEWTANPLAGLPVWLTVAARKTG